MALVTDPNAFPGLGVIIAIRLAATTRPPPSFPRGRAPTAAATVAFNATPTPTEKEEESSIAVLPPLADCVVEMLPVSLPLIGSRKEAEEKEKKESEEGGGRLTPFCERFGSCVTRFELNSRFQGTIDDADFLNALPFLPNLRLLNINRAAAYRPKVEVDAIAKSTMVLLKEMIRISDRTSDGTNFISLRSLTFDCGSLDVLPPDPAVVWMPFLRSCCSSSMSSFSVSSRLPPGYLKAVVDHCGDNLAVLHARGYDPVASPTSSTCRSQSPPEHLPHILDEEVNLQQMTHLRELTITRQDPATLQTLPRLFPKLQHLVLDGKVQLICGRSLGMIVKACPGLKHIDDPVGNIDDFAPLLRSLIDHGSNLAHLRSGSFFSSPKKRGVNDLSDASSPSWNLLHPLWEEFFTKRGGQLLEFGVSQLVADQKALSMISSRCPKLLSFYFSTDERFDDAALQALSSGVPTLRFVFLHFAATPSSPNLTIDGFKRFVAALPNIKVLILVNIASWLNSALEGHMEHDPASTTDLRLQREKTFETSLYAVAMQHDFCVHLC